MEKTFLVWREECNREDARRVKARDAEQAACRWAEWVDSWGADYSIVSGSPEVVFVCPDDGDAEPMRFEVSGEAIPMYSARAMSPNVGGNSP